MSDEEEIDGAARRRALSNAAVLAFVWRQWMRRPWRFALILAFMLAATAFDLSIPWAAGGLVGAVSQSAARRADVAWRAWGLLSGAYVCFYALRQVGFRVMNGFAAGNMEGLVNDAFARVQDFSSDWHADTFAGSTVRKVSRGMWGYDNVSDVLLLMLGPSMIVLIGLSVSMLVRNVTAGTIELTLVLVYMAVNVTMTTRWIRPVNLRSNALDSRIGGALADAIGGNPAVKSFGAELRERERFAQTVAKWRAAATRTWNRFADLALAMNVLLIALQASLTGFLVQAWIRGQASPADVAFAVTSFMLMAGYLRNFGDMVRNLQKGLDDLEDIAAFEKTPPQVADKPDAEAFVPGPGEIVFDQVVFRYKSQSKPVYDGFDLRIAPGERVALVGPTGAGKSTFVKLVQRLYDLDGGRILIDGQDIAHVTQSSLRAAVAVVPQDPALFHRSLAENIAYARPGATMDEIREAARRAHAHDFIARLPKGYDTLVGERGVKLSGGERQRVAIARAFLADAPILLLDEATSSLDVETEREVQAATEALMAGRTTIVIAHRLSTIRGADRILVFAGGRIVEEGRHRDLVNRGGAYARLHAVTEGAG
jgi:ATP-binding cassette subfamily B protein